MICLLSSGEWVPFESDENLIDYLGGVSDFDVLDRRELRSAVGHRFRPAVQAKAISQFPLQTIAGVSEDARAILYSSHPAVATWELLPPLVVVSDASHAPQGIKVDAHSTVWVIDTTSDRDLLDSLVFLGALSLERY